MAGRVEVHLNHANIAAWLKTVPAAAVSAIAEGIAEQAREANDTELGVYTSHHTTDRARSTVSVPAFLQARDGVLTKGLSAAGLRLGSSPRAGRSRR